MEALPTEKVSELKAHVGPVLAVRFNRDGNYCLTCGQDRLIKLWNPSKGLVVKTYVGHGHEVCSRIPSTPLLLANIKVDPLSIQPFPRPPK